MKFTVGKECDITVLDRETNKVIHEGKATWEVNGHDINVSIKDDSIDCYDCDIYYLNCDTGCDCQGQDEICYEFRFKR